MAKSRSAGSKNNQAKMSDEDVRLARLLCDSSCGEDETMAKAQATSYEEQMRSRAKDLFDRDRFPASAWTKSSTARAYVDNPALTVASVKLATKAKKK